MTNECTSVVGHFDGHGSAPGQYRQHCPMWHVQGYPRSYWALPSGDYLLRIAPVAPGGTANETKTKKWTNFAGHFDGRGGALEQYRAHCPMEEVQGFTRSYWTPPLGKYYVQ